MKTLTQSILSLGTLAVTLVTLEACSKLPAASVAKDFVGAETLTTLVCAVPMHFSDDLKRAFEVNHFYLPNACIMRNVINATGNYVMQEGETISGGLRMYVTEYSDESEECGAIGCNIDLDVVDYSKTSITESSDLDLVFYLEGKAIGSGRYGSIYELCTGEFKDNCDITRVNGKGPIVKLK